MSAGDKVLTTHAKLTNCTSESVCQLQLDGGITRVVQLVISKVRDTSKITENLPKRIITRGHLSENHQQASIGKC